MAGIKSYAQNDPDFLGGAASCAPITSLTCADDDEIHPLPGKEYTYTVGTDGVTDIATVHWFVVNATATPNILSGGYNFATVSAIAEANGGTSLFLLNAESHYNTQSANPSIKISWQAFNASTTDILLVAYVEGDNCADNIEAWKIEPSFSFALDIAGLMPNGTLPASGNANECVSDIHSASYDGSELTMDYGFNYVFFTVTATNFVHSWMPELTAVVNGSSSTVSSIEWAYQANAQTTGAWNSSTTAVVAQNSLNAVGDAGECIIVRVLVDHNNVENDTPSSVTLTVNGVMYDVTAANYTNTVAYSDLDNPETAGDPCRVGSFDVATYDITPRPSVIPVNPTDLFIGKN